MLENIPINESDKWFNWLQKACLRLAELPSVTPKTESRNVLAEIKAEIEKHCCITVGSEDEPAITLYDVFKIIDKYKAESEGTE